MYFSFSFFIVKSYEIYSCIIIYNVDVYWILKELNLIVAHLFRV